MTIVDVLEQNSRSYGDEVCLVEINPEVKEIRRVTWKEYELIEPNPMTHYRREITWRVFDEKANRFANLLISRGIKKGDKVAILLMNCLEWLPIYFGIMKTGALAVPLNFRYAPDEIRYCVEKAEADVFPIDMGIACEVEHRGELYPLTERKIRRGTSNFTKAAAMTRQEVLTAILTGIDAVRVLKEQGYRLSAVGEMGIGNTTTSSAVASVLLQKDPELVTGAGAGLDSAGLKRKTEAIRRGIGLHHPDPMDGMEVLQKVGGFDLAAMAGAFLGGAIYHVPVVIDGVIAAAAAAAAGRIAPAATDYMLAAHVSAEPASIWLLDLIGVTPAIQAGLRLGEGTGALALFPLLDMALSIYRDMDTFAEMEIEEYKPLV